MKTKIRNTNPIMRKGGVHDKPKKQNSGYDKTQYCIHGVGYTAYCEHCCDKPKEDE